MSGHKQLSVSASDESGLKMKVVINIDKTGEVNVHEAGELPRVEIRGDGTGVIRVGVEADYVADLDVTGDGIDKGSSWMATNDAERASTRQPVSSLPVGKWRLTATRIT